MLYLAIVFGVVVLVHVVMVMREQARDAAEEPPPDIVGRASVSQLRRRPIRDSLSGFVGNARESWRLFKDDRMSKAVSGEIVSPTERPTETSRPPARQSNPPPAQE